MRKLGNIKVVSKELGISKDKIKKMIKDNLIESENRSGQFFVNVEDVKKRQLSKECVKFDNDYRVIVNSSKYSDGSEEWSQIILKEDNNEFWFYELWSESRFKIGGFLEDNGDIIILNAHMRIKIIITKDRKEKINSIKKMLKINNINLLKNEYYEN